MTNRRLYTRPSVVVAAVVLGAAAWYLFRPELLFVDRRVNDAPPMVAASEAPSTLVASGRFVTGAHETAGDARVLRAANGIVVLRLEGFHTSNGPDVHVYLVAADTVTGEASVKRAEFVDLGVLKGNIGDQNYEVPAGTDLAKYRAVSIWCKRFSVNFGAAALR